MTENEISLVKEVIGELIGRMGLNFEIVHQEEPSTTIFSIQSDDSRILIGQYGSALAALQHLARAIVFRRLSTPVNFVIDVGGYKQERNEHLKRLALSAIEKAKSTERDVELSPMPSYERRVIHETVSQDEAVESESVGQEPDRRVRIRYKK